MVIVSEVETVVPATVTLSTGTVKRARWTVENWMASDLSGFRASPLQQNQECRSDKQLSMVDRDALFWMEMNNCVSSAYC